METTLNIKQASAFQIAKWINENRLIIGKEQVDYLCAHNSDVFSKLSIQSLEKINITQYFANTEYLLKFAYFSAKKSALWQLMHDYIQENKKEIESHYFDNGGVLLKFLSPEQYEHLALDWIGKNYTHLSTPSKIFHFLNEKQIKKLILKKAYNWIYIDKINPQAWTMDVAKELMSVYPYSPLSVYKYMPEKLQENFEFSWAVCARNKKDYLHLCKYSQYNLLLLNLAMDNVIPPSHDADTWHEDKYALDAKDVPLDVVLNLRYDKNDEYQKQKANDLIQRILESQPELSEKSEVKKQWKTLSSKILRKKR